MAGESPDRSKRYESSTGSTPGSGTPGTGAAVSASGDPRLTMGREAAVRGTDQATAVFTRRDLAEAEAERKDESADAEVPGASADAKTSEGAAESGDSVKEGEDSADVDAGADGAGSDGAGSDSAGSDSAGSGGTDGADDDGTADDEPKAGTKPEDGAEGAGDDGEGRTGAGAKAQPQDDAGSDTGAGTGSDTGAGAGSDTGPKGDSESAGDADTGSRKASDKASDEAPEPPVDQPTAIFKAVPAPKVDQPTTMLKLGDKPPAGKPAAADTDTAADADDEGGPKPDAAKPDTSKQAKSEPDTSKQGKSEPDLAKRDTSKPDPAEPDTPERDAERTSKFVALKSLDEPAPRKPAATGTAATGAATAAAAPAEATAAVPQVGPERTTQQPLPPKPPLDLLAELTNTPPPPPTPMRTLARRVKIWTPLVVLLLVVFAVVQSLRPLPAPTLDLAAEDTYTFEGGKPDIPWPSAGQAALDVQGIGTFGSSGEQKPVPIASVAKVMTAYLVLRDHPVKSGEDGPMIEIDQTAEDESDAGDESTVNVTAGDSISEREAVESILIASANNVARLLARWDAGSEEAFVEKMNKAAEDLGMTNTTYTDPSGLNNTTVSTAVDQVKLAKEAMKQPVFREVAAMMSYDDYKGVNHSNWNQLVGSNNVVGIKTGTTTSALGNLVFAAKQEVDGEPRTIVGAVVRQPAGGPDNTILGAALFEGDKLIRAAQGALESATVVKKGDVVGYVDDGLGGRTPVVATEDVHAVGWAGLTVKLTFEAGDLPHTAKAGTEVGTLTVGDGTSSAVKVPVALRTDLVEPGFTDKLTRLG
ncbi:D-alanyl-D-alanine carboxypeptidase [Streptomyces ruber]|uniref:serine-type D-Ala-D-Ala carboxypeptidase n=2 Tax=Streptomyces TaxID=1883 RepID=A0A918B8V1_9ACTN|nr:D-alanyl-D-alanine carboxypeptidase [Streptomyces ruber]GGQ38563.1 D-alanyl-D-alanine carboxypeptidase [Streptomyces ruber]